jgi:hypothetical protein
VCSLWWNDPDAPNDHSRSERAVPNFLVLTLQDGTAAGPPRSRSVKPVIAGLDQTRSDRLLYEIHTTMRARNNRA